MPTNQKVLSKLSANDNDIENTKAKLLRTINLYKERKWMNEKEVIQIRKYLTINSNDIEKSIQVVKKGLHAIKKANQNDGKQHGENKSTTKHMKVKEDVSTMNTSMMKKSTNDQNLRKKLLSTISSFKKREWIDETEEEGLRSLLSPSDNDSFVPSTESLIAIEKRLKTIKSQKIKDQNNVRKDRTQHNLSSAQSESAYKVHKAEEMVDSLSKEAIEQLFTEMCFFAKFKFVQPISCLHCVYNQSQGKLTELCHNLVVWRQNADYPLHPEKLDNNLLIVSCSTAKAWMKGKEVQGLRWNEQTKQIQSITT